MNLVGKLGLDGDSGGDVQEIEAHGTLMRRRRRFCRRGGGAAGSRREKLQFWRRRTRDASGKGISVVRGV
ncbi:hypothetical protein JHK82_027506 [Glycine max]|nr:hypothetical protein JHK87_027397 [Glycine soja]KAG5003493.1 hypothetical protein JHK86_027632 [Glycine max]KAG5126671.1 hypothetical protein JHK82_027506 [Glycine max]